MTKYTDEMTNELRTMGVIDYELATKFAEKHEISVRSVIAKVRALELPYKPKETAAEKKPTKKAGPKKAEVAAEIEQMLQTQFHRLDALTADDLETLRKAIASRL